MEFIISIKGLSCFIDFYWFLSYTPMGVFYANIVRTSEKHTTFSNINKHFRHYGTFFIYSLRISNPFNLRIFRCHSFSVQCEEIRDLSQQSGVVKKVHIITMIRENDCSCRAVERSSLEEKQNNSRMRCYWNGESTLSNENEAESRIRAKCEGSKLIGKNFNFIWLTSKQRFNGLFHSTALIN